MFRFRTVHWFQRLRDAIPECSGECCASPGFSLTSSKVRSSCLSYCLQTFALFQNAVSVPQWFPETVGLASHSQIKQIPTEITCQVWKGHATENMHKKLLAKKPAYKPSQIFRHKVVRSKRIRWMSRLTFLNGSFCLPARVATCTSPPTWVSLSFPPERLHPSKVKLRNVSRNKTLAHRHLRIKYECIRWDSVL